MELATTRTLPANRSGTPLIDAINLAIGANKITGFVIRLDGLITLTHDVFLTGEEENTILQLVQGFDLSTQTAAEITYEQRKSDFIDLIQNKAPGAITDIDSELAILNSTPTNAQVIAILKANEQRQKALIKAFLRLADFVR